MSSRRLSAWDRDKIIHTLRVIGDLYNPSVGHNRLTPGESQQVYDVVTRPVRPALDTTPPELLTTVDKVFISHIEGALRKHVGFIVPLPDLPWYTELVEHDTFRIERASLGTPQIVMREHPDWNGLDQVLLDRAATASSDRERVNTYRSAVALLLHNCNTTGQLLSLFPQVREFLPEHLRRDQPTNRGVAHIKTTQGIVQAVETVVALLARAKIEGKI